MLCSKNAITLVRANPRHAQSFQQPANAEMDRVGQFGDLYSGLCITRTACFCTYSRCDRGFRGCEAGSRSLSEGSASGRRSGRLVAAVGGGIG